MTFPVVTIMVKNEEEKICKTLLPFVEAGYKNFLVYDTGSEDRTVEVVTVFLSNVNLVLKQEPFVDFATSRNKLIEYTNEEFKNEKLFIMLDCEWYINGADRIVSENLNFPIDRVCNIYVTSDCKTSHSRIFNIGTTCRFSGPVHEYIPCGGLNMLPDDIYFEYSPTEKGREKTVKRFERDLVLILKFLEENKDEPRYTFYLAQTYICLGNEEESLINYAKRYLLTTGYIQERYIAALRAGRIFKHRGEKEYAIVWFMKAWSCVQTRIEAPLELAKIHDYPEIYLKFFFALKACTTIPTNSDTLFVEETEYERWNQLSIGAYHVGEHITGLKALMKSVKVRILNHDVNNFTYFKNAIDKNSYNSIVYNKKIINLILYSEDEYFPRMRSILEIYLNFIKIEYYFYMFKDDIEEDYIISGKFIYIKGSESKLPGILDKTIKALEIINEKEYDYIVRSNISTVVNFPLLNICLEKNYDYSGPLYYSGCFQRIEDGITEDFYQKYHNLGFVSGICIAMSKKCVKFIIENQEELRSYSVIDDVAIGVLVNKHKSLKTGQYCYDKLCQFVYEIPSDPKYVCYRNKNDDREKDILYMHNSVTLMLNNLF